MNGTRKSGPSENIEKRSRDTPVEKNGSQMLMAGIKMDGFDEFSLLSDVTEQCTSK